MAAASSGLPRAAGDFVAEDAPAATGSGAAVAVVEAQQLAEAQRGAIEAQLARAQQLAQAQLTEAARAAAAEAQAASEAAAAAAARAAARVAKPLFEEAALTLAIAQVRLARLPACERGTSTLLNEVSQRLRCPPQSSPRPYPFTLTIPLTPTPTPALTLTITEQNFSPLTITLTRWPTFCTTRDGWRRRGFSSRRRCTRAGSSSATATRSRWC